MGIVNVTPDSFSDGGSFVTADAALAHAEKLLREGADLLDIGGESTRPGADQISIQQELDRVMPLLERLRHCPVPVSIDTCKPQVMAEALSIGVDMVNDVSALESPGALALLAPTNVAVCLMHKRGDPKTMQSTAEYQDVLVEVADYLKQRRATAIQAGIAAERIILDPGFGFGKTYTHNIQLFRGIDALRQCGAPLLIGVSRKAMIGQMLHQRTHSERDVASAVAAAFAAQSGAAILRVHNVQATRDALAVWRAFSENT